MSVGPSSDSISARPPIEPIRSEMRVQFTPLTDLERIKEATLWVLERVGVRFPSERALAILAEHGVHVDKETQIARFPEALVLEAMARAPRSFVLAARDASCDLDLASGCTFCTTDGCGTQIVDFETRQKRASVKADVAAVSRLVDALPGLAFWWPTLSAGDYGETAQLHELDAGLRNTVKHLQPMVQGARRARYAVEMVSAVAGGAEALRRRPIMSDYVATISPLVQDPDGIEAALVFAAAGVPVSFVTMPTLGTTAPATKAGAYVVGGAELVSATVLLQLAYPGAPVIHSYIQSFADPRSGAMLGFPLDTRNRALGTDIAHHWGVPAESTACGTDSEVPGTWQAGVEEGTDFPLAALEGSELLPTIGLTQAYTCFYPEHLILGHDVYQRARHAVMSISTDDDSLALDTIAAAGPGGHYLGQRHTRAHLREWARFTITQVQSPNGGFRDPIDVAREEAERLYHEYVPEPLPPDLAAELDRITAAADGELR